MDHGTVLYYSISMGVTYRQGKFISQQVQANCIFLLEVSDYVVQLQSVLRYHQLEVLAIDETY